MKLLRTWLVVLALMASIATPWTLLQSAAWFGMLVRYSSEVSFRQAIEMTFGGQYPCQLCKIVREAQQEEREQGPGTSCSDTKFELALPPWGRLAFYPPSLDSVFSFPDYPGQRPLRPPVPPPRLG